MLKDKIMKINVRLAVMSHLSDAEHLIELGLGDKAHHKIEMAKMIILNFDDLDQEVDEDDINIILAKWECNQRFLLQQQNKMTKIK